MAEGPIRLLVCQRQDVDDDDNDDDATGTLRNR